MRGAETVIEWPVGGQRVLTAVSGAMPTPLNLLLAPLAAGFRGAVAVRNRAYDAGVFRAHRVGVPVISIGNVVAGGAGKTPVTRWLAAELLVRGKTPAILHGGYGLDEPQLHQQWHPGAVVVTGRDRVAAATRAMAQGADIILLDDAFQHRRLARDLDIVLLSAESNNMRMIPQGPAREPLHALRRADFVLVTRKTALPAVAEELQRAVGKYAGAADSGIVYLKAAIKAVAGPVIAVASIARPDLFLRQLEAAGVQVERMLAYPDHHEFSARDVAHIRSVARSAALVTTAKDAVKLRPLMTGFELTVVEQEMVFEAGRERLLAMVERVL